MINFDGKKVIVTGANRSIGRQIAVSFAEHGADVVISYRNDVHGAEETVQQIKTMGRNAKAIYADFSEMSNVATFAKQAIDHLGAVDVLVNNVGMLSRQTLLEFSPEDMQHIVQVNALSPLYLTQLCAKDMVTRRHGSIINISSIAATYTGPQVLGYGTSKAAMNKWTKHAALDLGKHGVRVNAVAPGIIKAGVSEHTETIHPEIWQHYLNNTPLQRSGTPLDVANMVLFLASDMSSWITGKVFVVDGGYVL